MAETETQTAYAKSAFSDPINIINFLALLFTLPAINAVIPVHYHDAVDALVAALNLALRTFFAPHPVTATIGPGQVKPIEIKKLEATKPGTEDPAKLPPTVQPPTGP